MVRFLRRAFFPAALAGATFIAVGCSNPPAPVSPGDAGPAAPVPSPTSDGAHGHQPTAHGGIVVPIGSDSYHAEAVFEKGGLLRLYTLGQNEAVVLEVEAQPLTGYARVEGGLEAESFALVPRPQPGDRPGMTSLFVGRLPGETGGKKVEVTIPSIRLGGERFRVGFTSAPAAGEHDMPAQRADADERQLYLTPGGKYTAADIAANGGVVAAAKFKGLKAEHDLKPKPGEAVCPVTLTKASPKFSWVVGGRTYEFCCPPCVAEFVALAKEKPDEVRPPELYRKK